MAGAWTVLRGDGEVALLQTTTIPHNMNHDHGGHGGTDHGGGDMDMGAMCSMNMLWNTQIIDTCIVFPSWHIRSHGGFVLSCVAIVGLGLFYEWLRFYARRVDRTIARSLVTAQGKGRVSPSGGRSRSASPRPNEIAEDEGLLSGRRSLQQSSTKVPVVARLTRATLYASTVFLSFFLMLVFMTYNAYLIIAVVLGAGLGHFLLNDSMDADSMLAGSGVDTKGMACH